MTNEANFESSTMGMLHEQDMADKETMENKSEPGE